MQKNDLIQDKSFAFTMRLLNLYKHLTTDKKEFVLSRRLLHCGTSIGVNVEEAIGATSDKDFLSRLGIAYKDARESIYWLKFLNKTNYLKDNEFVSLLDDAEEICEIIGEIQIGLKSINA